MTTFKLEWRFKADENIKVMRELLDEIAVDLNLETLKIRLVEQGNAGRKVDSEATKRVKQWVEKRSKPFEAAPFEKFTGLSKSSAHRRLSRLVAAGVYKKRWVDGRVEYYRPSDG